jgi:carbonic anhydrase
MQRNQPTAFAVLSATFILTLVALLYGAPPSRSKPVTADEALRDLMDGNARFAKGEATSPRRKPADFRAVSGTQTPTAVVIACADSRVSPELLFDAGIGEVFVIRVAGNVVEGAGAAVKGSIEYAIAELNVPLVVVLGHTNCGAVKAAVQHIDQKDSLPGSINGLVELIKPAVSKVQGEPGDLYENVTRANVGAGVERLKSLQPIIAPRVEAGSVKVVGGVYDLKTGKVQLVDGRESRDEGRRPEE